MNKPLFYSLLGLLIFNASVLMAQWEPTGFNVSTWELCETGNGNFLASDDIYPEMGGLYISQDKGESWEATLAGDYAYQSHLVKDESVYFGGVGCNIAISHDNGDSWTNVDFSALFPGVTMEDGMYAIEYHNGRIYAAIFGYGVAYSDDDGATWNLTDIDSLLDDDNPENGGQWTYDLRSYNGKLYNSGSFGIWEYNEAEDLWTNVDDTWYSSSSCVVDDVFYAVYNAVGIPNGIRYTTDFQNWEVMPLPDDVSTSIRFLKYYQGAFFMGHVNEAIYYTLDHGETWVEYREDFPVFSPVPGVDFYGVPMDLIFTDDTMYAGVFSAYEDVGGVYKAPIPADILSVQDTPTLNTVVYPNPTSNFVSLQFSEEITGQGNLIITDALGRQVYHKDLEKDTGNVVSISVLNWSSGIYHYTLKNGSVKDTGKFIVK